MKHEDYVRKAKVVRVVDGDTLEVVIDLGLKIYKNERVRLARVDCPERFTLEGRISTGFVTSTFATVRDITIQTGKNPLDKYGRYIAEVWLDNGDNLSDILLRDGLAELYSELSVNVLG